MIREKLLSMAAETRPHGVIGVGYEGAALDAFVARLASSGVSLLVDVRLNAISRKRGFSKRGLAEALNESGIRYEHAPEQGNPTWNRTGFSGSAPEAAAARAAYGQLLQTELATARLDAIAEAAAAALIAVMCVESDECRCHRDVVLRHVRDRLHGFAPVA
jgi:uncharacterized protein (DUF488 family)